MINDTGETCHGFEIELEGVHPSDISFTFGSPYIRYGDPVKIDTGTGTIVRYASSFDSSTMQWAAGTPFQDPNNPVITGGHQLFYSAYGGDPNYINLPGDHFGVALNGNPTNTIYRWLLGDATGNLSPAGSNVKIPAPAWNVAPPVNPAAPAAVQAVVPAVRKKIRSPNLATQCGSRCLSPSLQHPPNWNISSSAIRPCPIAKTRRKSRSNGNSCKLATWTRSIAA